MTQHRLSKRHFIFHICKWFIILLSYARLPGSPQQMTLGFSLLVMSHARNIALMLSNHSQIISLWNIVLSTAWAHNPNEKKIFIYRIKEIVHPKLKFCLASCCSKPVWVSFYCWRQRRFWIDSWQQHWLPWYFIPY